LLEELVDVLLNKKAQDVLTLDLNGISSFTDFFLIATGETDRQTHALYEGLIETLNERGVPFRVEGTEQTHWILVDLGNIVVHLFTPELRAYYTLEDCWSQAQKKVYL
jgi:ribosome-associated protein